MAFLTKSLSQDVTDRYCDTWAFLFLSVLAISFLFVPLAPSLTLTVSTSSQEAKHPGSPKIHEIKKVQYPKYNSICWTPAHFAYSLRVYSNNVCATAINSLARGKGFSKAGLYQPIRPDFMGLRPDIMTKEDFQTSQSFSLTPNDQIIERQSRTKSHRHKRDKFLSDTKILTHFKTPLFLIVFAICLRLPHAIWSLLLTCCGCMNVDQTLSAAQQMHSKDSAGHKKMIRKDLSETLGRSAKRSASSLYLLMKILMFAVLLAGFKASHDMLIEIDRLENDWSRLELNNGDNNASHLTASLNSDTNSSTETRQALKPPFNDRVLLCDFSVRVLDNIQRYTVQCLFTLDQSRSTSGKTFSAKTTNTVQTQKGGPDYEKVLLMYKCLFTIVVSLLIILTLLTVGSLIVWLVKLLLPSCRPSMGLKGDEALDVVFIVAMAWMNTSPTVAMDLAKCTAVSDKQQSEGDAFELN